ncbi:MAG: LysM peptidoglycan-binding domain-containing protein [Deltaproteobacteria bacterium]|nr:LysM peptidoglycan-binding domain-containing protein [Deltaproteobacteria bacterium]
MRNRWIAAALGLVFALVSASAVAAPEDFPKPAKLVPRVEFWKRVYTEVGTDGGFLHDPDDLTLVYERISLPNGQWDKAGYKHVEARKKHVAHVLSTLANGKRGGLSEDEQRILALFETPVSTRKLKDAAAKVRFQLGQSDKFRAGLARQGRWDGHIRQVLAERGLPTELGALPHVESSFNPAARSSVGASGIWQFMPSTGRLYMRVDSAVDERNDPFMATVAAARLLKSNYEAIGSWPLAITGYNHGLGGTSRAARQLGTKDIAVIIDRYQSRSFGFASKNFYASFVAAMEIDREPEKYFGAVRRDPPEDPERVILDAYYRPSTLAQAFGVSMAALREVNPAVSESVWSGRRHLPRGYELRVPRDPMRASPKVVLASIGGGERIHAQVADSSGTHKVRRGETLAGIAKKYGVSTKALQRANGLRSANLIRVGQRLKIPGYAPPHPQEAAPPSATTASAAVEPSPTQGVYRVKRGDTLASIARRFGVSARDLATVNHIRNANEIHPGQVIELPGGSLTARPGDRSHAGVYSVRRGDTLDSIAKKFDVDVKALLALNEIRNKNVIRVGQTIYVPGPPEPPATEAPAEAVAPAPVTEAAAAAPELAPTSYVVRRGDTLEKIASRTGVAASELIALNGIRNRNLIAVGQTLVLSAPPAPAAQPEAPVAEEPAAIPPATPSGR